MFIRLDDYYVAFVSRKDGKDGNISQGWGERHKTSKPLDGTRATALKGYTYQYCFWVLIVLRFVLLLFVST